MKLLIVGGGAREHALAWAAARSARRPELLIAPGNAGTEALGQNVPVDPMDLPALVAAAIEHEVDLAIVGPDDPLAAGVVDALQAAGVRTFGPTKAAAQIEASKAWSKQFMARHGIPTASFEVFDNPKDAHRLIDERPASWERVVVKADGLARGKGVIVCDSDAEAHAAVDSMMERRAFGTAGERIVIERCMSGDEASIFAICDGKTALPMGTARDHKRIFEGDRGPNTGGMGAYSPTRLVTPVLLEEVMRTIVQPVVDGLAAGGRPFTGFLYTGIMLADEGPQVIEFNARFGDPEAQVLLPRLDGDLAELLRAAACGDLTGTTIGVREEAAVTVVLASGGYPGTSTSGCAIHGIETARALVRPAGGEVFHASTGLLHGRLETAGGRVLAVTALGLGVPEARRLAYEASATIVFEGRQQRSDIAALSGRAGGDR